MATSELSSAIRSVYLFGTGLGLPSQGGSVLNYAFEFFLIFIVRQILMSSYPEISFPSASASFPKLARAFPICRLEICTVYGV